MTTPDTIKPLRRDQAERLAFAAVAGNPNAKAELIAVGSLWTVKVSRVAVPASR